MGGRDDAEEAVRAAGAPVDTRDEGTVGAGHQVRDLQGSAVGSGRGQDGLPTGGQATSASSLTASKSSASLLIVT